MKQTFSSDSSYWEIGPYHGSLPAAMKVRLRLDGEIISDCQVETGYLHRGLEKACELHSWKSVIAYSDHLDPEAAIFGEWVLCSAVESIAEIGIPPRARSIRSILLELTRISAHLMFIVRMARAVGSETIVHYVLRDRERILDLFELLTGARFPLNFLRFGGVRDDVTDGFIERILEVCEMVRLRLKEYNDLMTFNQGFLKRSASVGVLSLEMISRFGITGPNARGSGSSFDLRKEDLDLGYRDVDFQVPVGRGEEGTVGDIHDRFLVRLREMSQSMEILKQFAEKVPSGPFFEVGGKGLGKVPFGEAYARVESARGVLGCHVVSDGSEKPCRIQFKSPSLNHLQALPSLVIGNRLEDFPVIIASLDIGLAEADR